jgi:poly(hydroxyalkanoate) granule-associated protein
MEGPQHEEIDMVRKTNNKRAAGANDAAEAARTLWLASLGAVSLAQKQGGKLIEALVAEGEDFRLRTNKLATSVVKDLRQAADDAQAQVKDAIEPIRAQAMLTVRQVEAGMTDRIGDVLEKLGVTTKAKPKATRKPAAKAPARGRKTAARRRAA